MDSEQVAPTGDSTPIVMGRVAGVFGVKGWVKVLSFTEPHGNLLKYRDWGLAKPGASVQPYKLLEGRVQGKGLVALLTKPDGSAVVDRDEAATLVGCEVLVPRSALPKLKRGEVYLVDLVGLTVKSSSGGVLGVVGQVTSNGAQDVLVVRDETSGKPVERLIPFVRGPIIESVSLAKKEIVAHWEADWDAE